ncbi:MAG: Dyp-type peroxidase [Nannocystaceae bacterium]
MTIEDFLALGAKHNIPRNDLPQDVCRRLQDLQGHILVGHGRRHCKIAQLRFGPDDDAVTCFIRSSVAPRVWSAWDVLNPAKRVASGDVFVGFYVSARGRRRLGWPAHRDSAFEEGMFTRSRQLGDREQDWELEAHPDCMLICAADDPEAASACLEAILECAGEAILPTSARQCVSGATLPKHREAFGFRDGISQPRFFTPEPRGDTKLDAARVAAWEQSASPLRTVLLPEPGTPDACGSYLVFRRLRQNKALFDERYGADAECAAKLVGRYKNGAPLIDTPPTAHADLPANAFDYSKDPNGERCPLSAHVRKVHPRTGGARIVRRGMPYREKNEVGLLFMCWQSSLVDQYERIQQWANSQHQGGPDQLLGNSRRGRIRSEYVTMTGGDYFFAPSIQRLKTPSFPHLGATQHRR